MRSLRSPCLVGWAQVTRCDGEPLDAWAEALASTGVPAAAIDSLDVLYCQSWPYDDPAGRLAGRAGFTPRRQAYVGIGGTTPLELLFAAANRVSSGESAVCAIVGGEQLARVRAFRKAGERPPWSYRDPEKKPFPFEAPFHPAEVAHQLFQAYSTFALRDVARRARRGLGVDEHRTVIGELFAPMTEVAADNPHAWFPTARKGTELVEPGPDNRMVAFPYTKRLVAMMDVDMAAAVVVASPEAADRMGIASKERVHLRGWATAQDPVHVAEHDDLARSPGMARALTGALQRAGVGADDLAHADLYSCFPSSVLFALDALGISADGPLAPFTVTGGLPYAGGPGSCYSVVSLAAMAERLRADGTGYGLVSGVGMHMTKHAAAVLSATAGEVGAPASAADPGPERRRTIVDVHHGPATVAAYTVHHGPDGEPTDAVLVCDLAPDAGSARCYAAARDPQVLADLEAEEWVGREVVLGDGGAGVNLVEEIR